MSRNNMHTRTLKIFALALSVVAVAGCSGEKTTDYGSVQLQSGVAQLRPESQTITYPLDEYDASILDRRLVSYATDLLVRDCVREQGLDVQVVDRRQLGEEGGIPSPFGVWNLERASKFGYEEPPPSQLMQELLNLNSALPDDVQPTWTSCLDTVDLADAGIDMASLDGSNNLITRGFGESWTQASGTPEWTAAIDEWDSCIQKAGLQRDGESLVGVLGTGTMSLEQQVETAVKDVRCKDETDLVQRLADIVGSYELVFVDQNKAALVEQQKQIDSIVTAAQSIVATHGG